MRDVATRSTTGTARFRDRARGVLGAMGLVVATGLCNPLAWSQATSPPRQAPAPASRATPATDVEPAVDTSARVGAISAPLPAPPSTPRSAPPDVSAAPARNPGAAMSSAPANPPAVGARRGGRAMDRVDLESSQITGNRELPRVLYIVPWRAPAAGEIEGRPVNSLLYELTKPVDRDVFRRENRYFDALQATATASGAPAAVAPAAAPAAAPGGPEK